MEKNIDIVFVASCNVDLISYVKRMPKMGETLMGNSFKSGFGGKGANKAIACSRLGANCAVISKLGNDVFGNDYLKNFQGNNILIDYVFRTDEASTGVAPICVDENGDNSILVILGANLLLSPNDIDKCTDLIKNSRILVTNLELSLETVIHSLKLAKLHKITTILNSAPAVIDINPEIFTFTDYLILNEVEIEQLSDMTYKSVNDAKLSSFFLLEKYDIQIGVIVTLGSNGVIYTDKATKHSIHKTCSPVNAVDTCGAGDSFVGAFAHYFNKYGPDSIDKVLQQAADYATLTVQSFGTQSSYPYLKDIDEKFRT